MANQTKYPLDAKHILLVAFVLLLMRGALRFIYLSISILFYFIFTIFAKRNLNGRPPILVSESSDLDKYILKSMFMWSWNETWFLLKTQTTEIKSVYYRDRSESLIMPLEAVSNETYVLE